MKIGQVVFMLASAVTVPLALAAAQEPSAKAKLETWLAAVNGHEPGVRDDGATTIAFWPLRDLDGILASLKHALGGRAICFNCGDLAVVDSKVVTVALLKRAALLHADIAVLYKTQSGYALPADGREAMTVQDGQLIGTNGGTIHWEIGRLLLDLVRPDPSRDDDVRLWYRATSAFLQERHEYYELEPHLERALFLFPNDPSLLIAAGTLHEGYAENRIQNFVLSQTPDVPPMTLPAGRTATSSYASNAQGAKKTSIHAKEDEWQQAEGLFRRALAIDPALAEARVRLAHVLGLRDRHAEAAAEVQRALERPLPPLLEYYARLFLGRAHYALGQRDQARAAFDRAVALYPGAQSPHLALSQLARDRGDRARVLEELFLLQLPQNTMTREDPWWVYDRTHVPGADDLLARLRAAVKQ